MKKFLLLFVSALTLLSSCVSEKTTTYYLIRHAEKERTDTINKNPHLNKIGQERAKKWANYFENIDLEAVYSTKYERTMQTAKRSADSKGLEIQNYDAKNMYDAVFKKETKGKKVLIVGHSNTTPVFVNKILGEKKYKNMGDTDNASLYIVHIINNKKTSTIELVD
jgi:2,3-bisphosphoglycerate-dependent phosphoglycerate mutase